ncbi:MAG: ABC transporter permease, partial [Bacteroidetes bacterium]|nr:ABC transporter permease [Bacteroidota bacterium]
MNKFKYIISREYSVRVRKRTFWILTFLLPVLYAGLIGFSVYMSVNPGYEKQQVTVIDYSGLYDHYFQDSEDMKFSYAEKGTEQQILELMKQQKDFHLLVIPEFEIDDPSEFKLSSCKNSANFVEGRLESELSSLIKDQRINALGLEKEVINQLAPDIQINHEMIGPAGSERDNTDQSMVV